MKAFGEEVLRDDGELDRKKLGAMVFSDPALRRRLDSAVKMPIWTSIAASVAWHWLTLKRIVVLDVPLLFESGLFKVTDPIVVVWVPRDVQIRRLIERDAITEAQAISRINAQMPTDEKRARADIVIDNSGPRAHLESRVDAVLDSLLRSGSCSPCSPCCCSWLFPRR